MYLLLFASATLLISLTTAIVLILERCLRSKYKIILLRHYCEQIHDTIKFDIDIRDPNIFDTILRGSFHSFRARFNARKMLAHSYKSTAWIQVAHTSARAFYISLPHLITIAYNIKLSPTTRKSIECILCAKTSATTHIPYCHGVIVRDNFTIDTFDREVSRIFAFMAIQTTGLSFEIGTHKAAQMIAYDQQGAIDVNHINQNISREHEQYFAQIDEHFAQVD